MTRQSIIKPTHEDIAHIAFWDIPSYQILNFWLTKFDNKSEAEIFTSADAYENAKLANYCYLNRERVVKDLYHYLEDN